LGLKENRNILKSTLCGEGVRRNCFQFLLWGQVQSE
jgi:hypothetical protein